MPIDAHQHFWIYDPGQYPWIRDSMAVLRRNFLPQDLAHELSAGGFEGSIAVQARQNLEETRWLLELADRHEKVLGVVGWVDLQSDQVRDQLREFAARPKFVGVRHVVQDEPDVRFLLRPEFLRGLEQLREWNLTYDLLIYPKHLPFAVELARRFPEQPFVLDHLAKPLIRAGVLGPWADNIRALAECPNVSCKISGMVTEAAWTEWVPGDFQPYLEIVWEAFGEDRLMTGSDWPVCLVAGSYSKVMEIPRQFLNQHSVEIQNKVLGKNARKFYLGKRRGGATA